MICTKEREMTKKKKILFRDVALREADQVEGGQMSPRDRSEYVKYILESGIDYIEVGVPGGSPDKFTQCQAIVDVVDKYCEAHQGITRPILSGLAIAREDQIKAVKKAGLDMVHIYIPSDDDLLFSQFDDSKYGLTGENKKGWVIEQAVKMVKFAKDIGIKHIQYSPEGASTSNREYLWQVCNAVVPLGIRVLNIADTLGLLIGTEANDLVREAYEKVNGLEDIELSVHLHNDTDHSTANALQSILAGADCIEGTYYGLGERGGMTKFEAVLMNLHTRPDVFEGYCWKLKREFCVRNVRFISIATNNPMPRHWVVTGLQNSLCSSGSHQAIERKAEENGKVSPYYSWEPEKYGHGQVSIIINESSGRTAITKKLIELGIEIENDEQVNEIYNEAMQVSGAKGGKELAENELVAIAQNVLKEIPNSIKVVVDSVISGDNVRPCAVIKCQHNDQVYESVGFGNGCVNAVVAAVENALAGNFEALKDVKIVFDDWRSYAIAPSAESLGDAYIRITIEEPDGEKKVFVGRETGKCITKASAQAYANCISWYLTSLQK